MINFIKIPILILIGFILGMFIGKHQNAQVSKEKIHSVENVVQNSKIDTKKIDNLVKSNQRIERYYKNGKISKEIILGYQTKENIKSSSSEVTNIHSNLTTDTIKTFYPENNWVLGSYSTINSIENKEYKDISIQIGYRIIGNIYLTASSDIQLKNPNIGFQIIF